MTPKCRSLANQAAWYSPMTCSPGSQCFQRFMVSGSCSTSWSCEIVVLAHAVTYQHANTRTSRQLSSDNHNRHASTSLTRTSSGSADGSELCCRVYCWNHKPVEIFPVD